MKIGSCYRARSTAVDNVNIERGKRFGASLLPVPPVLYPLIVAHVALDLERRGRRTGAIMWRPSRSMLFVVVVEVVVVVLLASVTECLPSSSRSTSRYPHRRTKVCKYKRDIQFIDQSIIIHHLSLFIIYSFSASNAAVLHRATAACA